MNPDRQPDGPRAETRLVDPDAYDASEQQFAASIENDSEAKISTSNEQITGTDTSSWRQEVAERVNKYRRKSPREPRYPSLQLKFESDLWSSPAPVNTVTPTRQSTALQSEALQNDARVEEVISKSIIVSKPELEPVSNLIEFPRFTAEPPQNFNELADPVQDHLRILEAPDIAPTPPALGGILIEDAEEHPQERRRGFEIPLQSSSIAHRFAAASLDGMIVLTAVTLFGYLFLRLTTPSLPLQQWVEVGAILACSFWAAYQYLFLVYTGNTPGLRIAKLSVTHFDGTGTLRSTRQWRSLASVLSGISLGLGYLWCFLDEDQLCWHDRITKTHLSPKNITTKS
jgi:uncharacterized RDD family membrane protein YckC